MGGRGGEHKHSVYHYLIQNYSVLNVVVRWPEHPNLVT